MKNMIGKFSVDPRYDGENLYIAGFRLRPSGDCCANCYVQHVSGTDALQDAIILAVETIDSTPEMAAEDYDNSCDVSQSWGHRITTNKGICSIEMRLDHNGYYSGSLECDEYDGALDKTKPLDDF